MINAWREALDVVLPEAGGDPLHGWRRLIDTALAPPHEIQDWAEAPAVQSSKYLVQPRSIIVLFARTSSPEDRELMAAP
jgi:hypothetical protein